MSASTAAVAFRPATPDLVEHRVIDVLEQEAIQRLQGPLVVGIRAMPRWDHEPTMEVRGRHVVVEPCESPLGVRVALARHLPGADEPVSEGAGPVIVVLTDVVESDLGDDLLARFVRPRLFNLDVWQVVRSRFGVRRFDPALGEPQHRWLADALLQVPVDHDSTRGTTLDVDRAVDLVAAHVLDLTHVSLEQVLLATTDPTAIARFVAAPAAIRDGLAEELASNQRYGRVGGLIAGAIRSGHGGDVLPLGLASRALVGSVAGSYGQKTIETLTGVSDVDDTAVEALASAAELAFAESDRLRPLASEDLIGRADRLARDLRAPNPGSSSLLRSGFEARLAEVGRVVLAVLDGPGSGDVGTERAHHLRAAVDHLRFHRDASRQAGQVRTDGAMLTARLALWLTTDPDQTGVGNVHAGGGLGDRADAYLDDGAWVDWARRRVATGDTNEELAAAQRAVSEAAEERRAVGNQRFAQQLAHSTRFDPPGAAVGRALPVESIIADVVVTLARKLPVLLVVLDGCGLPAFLELAPQFRSQGLVEHAPGGQRQMGLAALPTVTHVSRISLLTGQLTTGTQADEKRLFASQGPLSRSGGPTPVVFHAVDLRSQSGAPLPNAVRDAIRADGPPVVAAIVNTIDDQLSRGTFTAAHRIEDIGVLPWLLRDAVDAGRAVVITADHGHVLGVDIDGHGAAAVGGEGGERWRVADRAPTEDEVLLQGPRVVVGDDRGILAPWHDVLRYAGWHAGYHGGATPDEVLVPLAVYLPAGSDAPTGWQPPVAPAPPWWDLAVPTEPTVAATPPSSRPARKKTAGQPSLFEDGATTPETPTVDTADEPLAAAPPWIDALLASDQFAIQLGALGRAKPPVDRVRATLIALAERGGVASFTTVAAATSMPLARTAPFLAVLSRVLNVDGYAVLSVDQGGSEVRLDLALAQTQFLGAL